MKVLHPQTEMRYCLPSYTFQNPCRNYWIWSTVKQHHFESRTIIHIPYVSVQSHRHSCSVLLDSSFYKQAYVTGLVTQTHSRLLEFKIHETHTVYKETKFEIILCNRSVCVVTGLPMSWYGSICTTTLGYHRKALLTKEYTPPPS